MAPPSSDGPLTLHFDDITRVAGETIQGSIEVNLPLAQEDNLQEIRVNFAEAFTGGTDSTTYKQTAVTVLSIPFKFTLPADLPASFHCWSYLPPRYHRLLLSKWWVRNLADSDLNRRIRRAISIVPAATHAQLLVRESLRQAWNGSYNKYEREEKLRRKIWGDYSHVRARIVLPALPSFPNCTPIPVSLYVETDTKPMKREDSPPTLSSEVKLSLFRWAQLRVQGYAEQVEDTFKLPKTLGDETCVAAIDSKDEKGKGLWRRAINFDGSVTINYAPTFPVQGEPGILEWKVCFINLFVPCPPPPVGVPGSSSRTYADILPPGPPPMLDDLPPAYWAGDHHGWDGDEKK
ncbi:hypothetical protein C8F01DRAFT_1105149 [Mycena amicta]|nr:hypothetical protein C8F01DRAFT_1105149 [Mycena amicta]